MGLDGHQLLLLKLKFQQGNHVCELLGINPFVLCPVRVTTVRITLDYSVFWALAHFGLRLDVSGLQLGLKPSNRLHVAFTHFLEPNCVSVCCS